MWTFQFLWIFLYWYSYCLKQYYITSLAKADLLTLTNMDANNVTLTFWEASCLTSSGSIWESSHDATHLTHVTLGRWTCLTVMGLLAEASIDHHRHNVARTLVLGLSNLHGSFCAVTMTLCIGHYCWTHFMMIKLKHKYLAQEHMHTVWLLCCLLWHCSTPTLYCEWPPSPSDKVVEQKEGKGVRPTDLSLIWRLEICSGMVKRLALDQINDWCHSQDESQGARMCLRTFLLTSGCYSSETSPFQTWTTQIPLHTVRC